MWGCERDDKTLDPECLSAPVFHTAVSRIRDRLYKEKGMTVDERHVVFTTDDTNPEYL